VFDVTTIGEGNIRLSVPIGKRINSADSFNLGISGAEGNVVGCLARLGYKTGWMSSLPNTPLGERVGDEYKRHGVNVEKIIWSKEHRLATLFVEYAKPPRSTKVIYDRKNTCFTNIQKEDIDWDYILNTKIIHLTGITTALSDNTREIVKETIYKAHENDIPISFDINYRNALWSKEEARETIMPLVQNIEMLLCSKRDAEAIFNCKGTDDETIRSLQKKTKAKKVVMSRGEKGVLGLMDDIVYEEPARDVAIVDRIGAGDGLVGGVLHGWLENDFAKGLKFGSLTAALALSQYGEVVNTNVDELNRLLINTDTSIVR